VKDGNGEVRGNQGSGKGIYPHWDYIGPDGSEERICLDGRREPE